MNASERRTQAIAIGVVLVFTVLGALGLWKFGGANREFRAQQRQIAEQKRAEAGLTDAEAKRLIGWAGDYVAAVQRGDCDYVIDVTIWMQERLEYARRRAAAPESGERAAREALCQDLRNVPKARRTLTEAGAEDAALLTDSAEVDIVSVDPGRDDLEAPLAGRVWMRIRYPSAGDAIVDEQGRPVKTIRVGVSFTEDGRVVKAGIIGNMELDEESSVVFW